MPDSEAARRIDEIVARLPAGTDDASAVDDWLDDVLGWVLRGRLFSLAESERSRRLRLLASRLKQPPAADFLAQVWPRMSMIRLFAESGLPARHSFVSEAWSRLIDRWVPRLDDRFDVGSLVFRLGLDASDVGWLEEIPDDVRRAYAEILPFDPSALAIAARLVAERAAAVGLSRPLLRLSGSPESESPFLDIAEAVRACAAAPDAETFGAWQRCRGRCQGALRRVHDALDTRGVSAEVLFLIELGEAQLQRIDGLLAVLVRGEGAWPLVLSLLRKAIERRSLRALVRSKLKRLSIEVVEHTGDTGEHYVAHTWGEFWQVARGAAIGGAVTAFTAAFKYALAGLGLAAGLAGLAHSVNYASSFLLIHFLGGSLASKQPAMTAAALARSLGGEWSSVSRVKLIAGISRAQAVAAAGNLILAVPVALLVDAVHVAVFGRSLLDADTAHHGIESLHPWHSWTLLYAALTGVLLWVSSLAAGLAVNWSAFRSLPEAIRHHAACRRLLGRRGAVAVSELVRDHIGGAVGYLSLGLLLGFFPNVLGFMGLPLEVRHVTLAGASLALAGSSQVRAGHVELSAIGWAAAGVLAVGALNFFVSFVLAFGVALRAHGLEKQDRRLLRRQIWTSFYRRPAWFVFPRRVKGLVSPPGAAPSTAAPAAPE